MDRTSDIATSCGVHPSAVVRFAQRFGFLGLLGSAGRFQAGIHGRERFAAELFSSVSESSSTRRRARRRAVGGARVHRREPHRTRRTRSWSRRRAVRAGRRHALAGGKHLIYVIGVRRSFAVASYIVYVLQHKREVRASDFGLRRHVSRTSAQREEGRCRDCNQLRAVRQGNAVLRRVAQHHGARRPLSSPIASFRRSRVMRAPVCS